MDEDNFLLALDDIAMSLYETDTDSQLSEKRQQLFDHLQ